MIRKILFFSISITILQGSNEITLDSTLFSQKAYMYEQVVYKVHIEIEKDFFNRLESLDIARLWLPFAKVVEIERIEGESRGDFIIYEMSYCIYPRESGKFLIEPLRIEARIGLPQDLHNDSFMGNQKNFQHITLFSKTHFLDVVEIDSQESFYSKTPLYGKSQLHAHTNTQSLQYGKPLDFSISLESYGDVFDLDFVLDIPNVNIYSSPSTITSQWDGHKYLHTLNKQFHLIAQDTYEIPSFGYSYVENNKTYNIATTPYAIHIQDLPLQPTIKTQNTHYIRLILIFILISLSGLGILVYYKLRKKIKLYTFIRQSHSYKELLQKILTHKEEYKVFIDKVETMLYSQTKKTQYDKKALLHLAKMLYNPHKIHKEDI